MGIFGKSDALEQQEQRDNDAENHSDLLQQLATAQSKVEKMTIARTPEGMMKMAEEAANEIEETFAVGGMSRAQRFLNITKSIRRQIAIACGGEALWTD